MLRRGSRQLVLAQVAQLAGQSSRGYKYEKAVEVVRVLVEKATRVALLTFAEPVQLGDQEGGGAGNVDCVGAPVVLNERSDLS